MYVDDLCTCAKELEALLKQLQMKPYEFDLKRSGALNFYLGCGFDRDEDGTLCMDPSKYIDKMEESYYEERLFGEQPNDKVLSPLLKGDHPELDTSILLEENDIVEIYQSLIGSMQWAVSIGQWDIQTTVMTLSSFRAQPRQGHLDRAKRVYYYLKNLKAF